MRGDVKFFVAWLVFAALCAGFVAGRWTTPEYVERQEAKRLALEERRREPDPDWMRGIMTPRDMTCDAIIDSVRDLLDEEMLQDGRSLNRP